MRSVLWPRICRKCFAPDLTGELTALPRPLIRLVHFILLSLVFSLFLYTGQLLVHFVPCCTIPDL